METQDKRKVFFSFRRPGGIGNRRSYMTLAEGLRQLTESEDMRPYIEKANAQGRDEVVGVFCFGKGHPLLVVVAAAPTQPVPEDEPSVPGGWDGSAAIG
jgi:hypothetical protein